MRIPLVRLSSFLCAALTLASCASVERKPALPVTAFVNVAVVPMTDAASIHQDQTVIVTGGTISAVGPAASVPVPAGAQRIDGGGRFLMPGLADMHVHLEHLEDPAILKLFVAHGVTTVRSMDGRPFILDWREQVKRGELIGPGIVTAGPIIDGKPPLRDDNLSVADAAEAVAAVNTQADAGYDFVKLYTNLSPAAYRAAAATARQRGLPVAGHVPRDITVNEAMVTHASIEHLVDFGDAIDGRPNPKWHWSNMLLAMPADSQKVERIAKTFEASGAWAVPTLMEVERRIAPPDVVDGWLASHEMSLVPADVVDLWKGQLRRSAARLDGDDWRLVERGRDNRRKLTVALYRSGSHLLAGSDTPNAFLVPGASLHGELEQLVLAGLSPGEALMAATRRAFDFLRVPRGGTVSAGAPADLVLLSANPLADIRNTRAIEGVVLKGRWLPRSELDALARALVTKQP